MSTTMVGIIVILVLVAIILFHFRKKIKTLKVPNVFLLTGTNGGGKSSLGGVLIIRALRKSRFIYYLRLPFEKFKKWFLKKFKNIDYEIEPKPMLYTNMPFKKGVDWNLLTKEIIFREVRIPYGSVCFIDEATLVFDSLMYKSDLFNDKLREFFKLFRHETHGGTCIITTQSLEDNHLSIRRCLGSYLFIHDRVKFPFITVCSVREMIAVNGDSSNSFDSDLDDSMKKIWFFNSFYKKYDTYYLSVLTDKLKIQVDYKFAKQFAKQEFKPEYILNLRDDYYELLRQEKENRKNEK